MLVFIQFLHNLRIATSLALLWKYWPLYEPAQCPGRFGEMHTRVFLSRGSLPLTREVRPFRFGASSSALKHRRLKWNASLYEKRYHYQLDGKRTPYCHS